MRRTLLVLAALALAACAPVRVPSAPGTGGVVAVPSPSPTRPPSPTGSPSPTPTTPAPRVQLLGTMTADGSGFTVDPAGATQVEQRDDGSLALVARVDPTDALTRLELHVAPDSLLMVVDGGIVTLHSATGGYLGAMPMPTATDDEGQPVPVGISAIDTTLVVQLSPEDRHAGGIDVGIRVGKRLIDTVTVDEAQGQPRYLVARTGFGHDLLGGGLGAPGARALFEEVGWLQARAMAPEMASVPSIRQQFDCHVLGGSQKETWNLEAFRPDYPDWLASALVHRCNWTDADLPEPTS